MGGVCGFVYLAIFNSATQEGLIVAAHVGVDPGADHRVVEAQGPHGSLALIVPHIGEFHGAEDLGSLSPCPHGALPDQLCGGHLLLLWLLRGSSIIGMICRSLGIRAAGNVLSEM